VLAPGPGEAGAFLTGPIQRTGGQRHGWKMWLFVLVASAPLLFCVLSLVLGIVNR